jgi:glutathione S-transferase
MTPADYPVLYSFRRCPYAIRARMALCQSGQVCELREVVLRNKPPCMVELSPKATVPILWLPDGQILDESLDIMRWALEKHDPLHWLGGDKKTQARIRAIVKKNDDEFKYHLDRTKYANRYEGTNTNEHRQAAEAFLSELEVYLTNTSYLGRDALSIGDVAIFPFIRQFSHIDRQHFDALPLPKLKAWLDAMLDSELFKQVMHRFAPWQANQAPVFFAQSQATTTLVKDL